MITLRHRFRKGEPHPDLDLIRLERRRPPPLKRGVYLEVIICPACALLYMATEKGQGCTHCGEPPIVIAASQTNPEPNENNIGSVMENSTYHVSGILERETGLVDSKVEYHSVYREVEAVSEEEALAQFKVEDWEWVEKPSVWLVSEAEKMERAGYASLFPLDEYKPAKGHEK